MYRQEVDTGAALTDVTHAYLRLYNGVHPHEAIGFRTPFADYLDDPWDLTRRSFHTRGHRGSRRLG